jgi:hypothetical protein
LSFTEDERRTLVGAAMAMGRDLMEQVVTIVKPKTFWLGNESLRGKSGTIQTEERGILAGQGYQWI